MVDTHCHLNFHAFEKDVDEVIKKAFAAGITKIINVGADLDSSKKAIEIAEKYDGLYATVGIHPHHADKLEKNWIYKLEELAKHPKVVAIGEIGLDFFNYESNGITDQKNQKSLFIKQIEIAHKLELPLQIHNRHAGKEILEILLNHKSYLLNPPGVFHCFSGDIEFLKKVLNLGFYIGFDGNITYKGLAKGETTSLKDLAKFAPIDRILTETDSPFLTPEPHRGTRNSPEYVIIVAESIAKIKNIPFEKVKEQTIKNTLTLFIIKD
ncbi:MAG: TatD family hydrolase [Patescibacteria group bacterium]|nr:TatD family hydrolase [Patescibacteria group bacterium]